MFHDHRLSITTIVVIGALAGGAVGFLGGAPVIDWIDPGPPDMSMEMLIAMFVVGGLGWIVGAAFGWTTGRDWPTPPTTTRTRLILLASAVASTLLGIVAIQEARYSSFGPMIDEIGPKDPLRERLVLSIALDTG